MDSRGRHCASLLRNSLRGPRAAASIHARAVKTGLLLHASISNLLIACYSKLPSSVPHAHQLFDEMPTTTRDVVSWNSVLSLHAKAGCIHSARDFFARMPQRDSVSWTTMIVGFNRLGRFPEALRTFSEMVRVGITPTQFTFTNILSSCADMEAASIGRKLHSFVVKLGLSNCVPVANSLLNFYGKCGDAETAETIFDKLPVRDISSLNTMVSLYAQIGELDIAVKLFHKMPEKNIISWNAVIAGFNQNGLELKALDVFSLMISESDIQPDILTLSSVLSSCANLAMLRQGKQIHAFIIRREALHYNQVTNALISMYAKSDKVDLAQKIIHNCMASDLNVISLTSLLEGYVKLGSVAAARNIFDLMKYRDVVAWTAMIVGYEQSGLNSEAMDLFQLMLKEGPQPNSYTLAAILGVCGNLIALDRGKQIHSKAIRSGEINVISVSNAVLTMYTRCGNVALAKRVFCKIRALKQTVTWNSMVVALAQHGMGEDAIHLFDEMLELRVQPDHITYVGVLSACVHAGFVQKGKMYFEQMQNEHKIEPTMSHYSCMIELLSRAGMFKETEDFIAKIPVEPDSVAWGSILARCIAHTNICMAEKAAERLLAIDPMNSGAYSTLANIYSTCGEWNKAAKIWRSMRDKGIRKEQGISSFPKSVSCFLG